MKLTTKRKLIMGAMFVAFSVTTASAQIGLPGDGSGDVGDTPAAPIDALLGLGLVAGACLGIKKVKK